MRSIALDVRCGITSLVAPGTEVATDTTLGDVVGLEHFTISARRSWHRRGTMRKEPVAHPTTNIASAGVDDNSQQRRPQDRGGRRRSAQGPGRGGRRVHEHQDPFADRLPQPCGPDVLELRIDAAGDEPQGQLAQRRQVGLR